MADNYKVKDPDAVLDFGFDWKPKTHGTGSMDWLETRETISSYVITAETGITVDSDSENDGAVIVWLSGGTIGEWYSVTCRIVTSSGRKDGRTIMIHVEDR